MAAKIEEIGSMLGRTVQQPGSFLLNFCALTDKVREDIQYTLEQHARDQNWKY